MLLIIKSSNDSTDTVLIFYLFIYFLRGGKGGGGWGHGGREIEGAFISLCEDPWSGQGMKPSKTVKF